MSESVRYVATLSNVREVFLHGSSDADYWRDALRIEGLVPVEENGRAKVQVSALYASLLGLRFSELSICVPVRRRGSADQGEALYLAHAYTGSRVIAWLERTWSSSPYHYGSIEVDVGPQPSIVLLAGGGAQLRARFAQAPEGPAAESSGWRGMIYLPRCSAANGQVYTGFAAKVEGNARVSPYRAERDEVRIVATPNQRVLVSLLESDFRPLRWGIRVGGTHSKSKTIRVPQSEPNQHEL